MAYCRGNKTQAAQMLGLSTRQLYYRLEKLKQEKENIISEIQSVYDELNGKLFVFSSDEHAQSDTHITRAIIIASIFRFVITNPPV